MKEAILYEKLKEQTIKCHVCAQECLILPGQRGICGTRENKNGTLLYTLVYETTISEAVDPIEKKPLFHFQPGSKSYSLATVGCNLRCDNCQNWQISQYPKLKPQVNVWGEKRKPEEIVESALVHDCQSIAYTYTEPTIFLEYALDIMKIARQKGLKNVWVSNGFMTEESRKIVLPYLDADNIDLKSFDDEFYKNNCGARLQPVLDTLKFFKKNNVWLEVTTLIIPQLSDNPAMLRKIAEFIYHELGADTPWHVSKFSGEISYKLQHLEETPNKLIRQAYKIGKEIGLKYVYAGNLWQEDLESTYCPKCGEIAIKRMGYDIERLDKNGLCPKCQTKLNLIL